MSIKQQQYLCESRLKRASVSAENALPSTPSAHKYSAAVFARRPSRNSATLASDRVTSPLNIVRCLLSADTDDKDPYIWASIES